MNRPYEPTKSLRQAGAHLRIASCKALRPFRGRLHLSMFLRRLWSRYGPHLGRLGHLLACWRHIGRLLVLGAVPVAEFAPDGGFPVHEEALLHDLEADGAAHLQ